MKFICLCLFVLIINGCSTITLSKIDIEEVVKQSNELYGCGWSHSSFINSRLVPLDECTWIDKEYNQCFKVYFKKTDPLYSSRYLLVGAVGAVTEVIHEVEEMELEGIKEKLVTISPCSR